MLNMQDSAKKAFAKQLIACLDLTRLSDHDPEALKTLMQNALTPFGSCAAVCVYPADLPVCHEHRRSNDLRYAAVANFPTGNESLTDVCKQIDSMLEASCDECDVVLPYTAFLRKEYAYCSDFLKACRDHFPGTLKVILETGCLKEEAIITDASQCALDIGADFLKTSTGHVPDDSLLKSVSVLLSVIQKNNRGSIKVSGGVRTMDQAYEFWQLIQETMGAEWMTPSHVRFGASSLLGNVLEQSS